jgi:hypothetical protein
MVAQVPLPLLLLLPLLLMVPLQGEHHCAQTVVCNSYMSSRPDAAHTCQDQHSTGHGVLQMLDDTLMVGTRCERLRLRLIEDVYSE